MPNTRPGIEKLRPLREITPIRVEFSKPSALSIPYSYVLASTSDNISEYRSIVERMAKNTTTVNKVA